jgi:hypothetical protein
MIKQVELSWSWTMFPSFDWHSEWPSIFGKKKDPIELCYNETKKTYSVICQDNDMITFDAFDPRQGIYGNITFHNAIRWRRITRKVNNTTVISNFSVVECSDGMYLISMNSLKCIKLDSIETNIMPVGYRIRDDWALRLDENFDNLLWGSVCVGSLIFDDNLEIVELERGKHSWYKLIDAFGEFIMYQYDDTGSYMLYRYESHKKKYVKCNYYCKKIPQPVIITPYEEGALYFDLTTDKFVLSEEIIRKQRKSWIRVDDSYSLYDAFENDSEVQNYLNN